MGVKYLYGASVQGIQSFIFQTNRLKEIVGASGLVEKICTRLFVELFKKKKNIFKEGCAELVVSAAGNVKCIFDSEEDCRLAVLKFPKLVMEEAPGITVSQAVVKMEDGNFDDAVDELEKRLRAQRNKPCKSLLTGCMAVERSRCTGLPVVEVKKDDYVDEGTGKKIAYAEARDAISEDGKKKKGIITQLYEKLYGEGSHVKPYMNADIKDMTDKNDWIAVIHADGNGLGEIVAKIGGETESLKAFSQNLSKVTEEAAQEACKSVKAVASDDRLYIRPVVIGGDDLTVICKADLAIPFVKAYLESFENKSETTDGVGKLSACAGIAFVKSSYPFYYAYDLAEVLCSQAKKDAKSDEMKGADGGQVPSCLMFHKVQSSFVEDYEVIKRKELTPTEGVSFCFGPYYLKEQKNRWTIDNLMDKADQLAKDSNNDVKTDVREWMTLISDGEDKAKQKTERVKELFREQPKKSKLYESLAVDNTADKKEGKEVGKYAAYDVLALLTINTQQTQNEEK